MTNKTKISLTVIITTIVFIIAYLLSMSYGYSESAGDIVTHEDGTQTYTVTLGEPPIIVAIIIAGFLSFAACAITYMALDMIQFEKELAKKLTKPNTD